MEKRRYVTRKLPLELESKILSKLPTKALLRFQSVCKRWREEIKSPNFIKSHTKHILRTNSSKSNLSLVRICRGYSLLYPMDSDSDSDSDSPQDVNNITTRVKLVGSCNGLICLQQNNIYNYNVVTTTSVGDEPIRFWLYNPITGAFNEDIPPLLVRGYTNADAFAGFGYDCTSRDYKILCIILLRGLLIHVESWVYSLKSNSWNLITQSLLGHEYLLYSKNSSMVLSNNALHWGVVDISQNWALDAIMSFDLGTNTQRELQLPNEVKNQIFNNNERHKWTMADVRGCLHLVKQVKVSSSQQHPDFVEIWVMKQYGVEQSWSKLIRIIPIEPLLKCVLEIERDIMLRFQAYGYVSPMLHDYSENGEEIQEILVSLGPYFRSLFRCELHGGGLKGVEVFDAFKDGYEVKPWVSSFVSPSS